MQIFLSLGLVGKHAPECATKHQDVFQKRVVCTSMYTKMGLAPVCAELSHQHVRLDVHEILNLSETNN